jgi:hypothetical protein
MKHWKYGYLWVTLVLFALSAAGHWIFGWLEYEREAQEHAQPILVGDYTIQMLRDMLENWQSEFLQLAWQVGGLAYLIYVGSPQSKDGDDRLEAKIDHLLSQSPEGRAKLSELDARYPRH